MAPLSPSRDPYNLQQGTLHGPNNLESFCSRIQDVDREPEFVFVVSLRQRDSNQGGDGLKEGGEMSVRDLQQGAEVGVRD